MNSSKIIFSAEKAEKFGGINGNETSFWTPTLSGIEELELLLPQYLRLHPPIDDTPVENLFDYGRQYYGVDNNGRRLICLNAFYRPERFAPQWKIDILIVKDGGSHFFHVYFDPIKKEFIGLHYNGKA